VRCRTESGRHAEHTIALAPYRKHLVVEKPLALRVAEGRRMVEAAHKYKRVTQVGLMRRSGPKLKEAAEFLRSGG